MTRTDLELRPATAAEVADWLPAVVASYAAEIAAARGMTPEAALEKSRADTARLLPEGADTPGHLIFRLIAGQEPVGWLWLAVRQGDDSPAMAWVYYVEVDESCRGRGHGRQLMRFAEREAKARGARTIGLNVRGGNTVARSLYDSLGYQVTEQQMRKEL